MKEVRGKAQFLFPYFFKNGIAIYGDFGGIKAIWIINDCYLQL